MEICGGATCGYCETGRSGSEMTPASTMKMATTQAKIGRSMKKLGIGQASLRVCGFFGGGRILGDRFPFRRIDLGPRPDLLKTLDDHLLAGRQALRDHPAIIEDTAGDDLADLCGVVCADDIDLRLAGAVAL